MFENLISLNEADYIPSVMPIGSGFTPDEKAAPSAVVDGMVATSKWLEELGLDDDEAITDAQRRTAQDAFAALTVPLDSASQKTALSTIVVPQAVQHLVGMLTAYDWAFVDQAKELRGYCIAQLLEETKHPDAKYRLKAIELLGKVTEVALFTERIEVKKAELSDAELEVQIKTRMDKYMSLLQVVEDVALVEEADVTNA